MVKRIFDISPASSLPEYREPKDEGACVIEIIHFCTSLAENVYHIGRHLLWAKKNCQYGDFVEWLEENMPFSVRSGQRFMKFARDCDGQDRLLEYHPEKERIERKTKAVKRPATKPGGFPPRKSIAQIKKEIEQEKKKRHRDVFGQIVKQDKIDKKELSDLLVRLYYKWGRETLEGWIREIVERL